MEFRRLGRTGLEVSRVSLGTGGPSRLGQRTHANESLSHRVVRTALDEGVNLIDTAAAYSDSEVILGRALKDVPRDSYYLATKCVTWDDATSDIISPASFIASCEESLRRLNVDTIDIFQFHGLEPSYYHDAVDRLFRAAQKLQADGKIRFIGVTEYFYRDPGHEMLEMALEEGIWDTIMVKYGILNMSAAGHVLPLAERDDVGVLNMSPVRIRLTQPDTLTSLIKDWEEAGILKPGLLEHDNPLGFLLGNGVGTIIEAGYKFGADHTAISSVVVGTGNPSHLRQNIAAILGPPIDHERTERLQEIFGDISASEFLDQG